MTDKELLQAISIIKSGNKRGGGTLLAAMVKREPENEMAWLWLSVCVGTNEQKKACLRKALEINPDNESTQSILAQLEMVIEPPSFSDVIGNLQLEKPSVPIRTSRNEDRNQTVKSGTQPIQTIKPDETQQQNNQSEEVILKEITDQMTAAENPEQPPAAQPEISPETTSALQQVDTPSEAGPEIQEITPYTESSSGEPNQAEEMPIEIEENHSADETDLATPEPVKPQANVEPVEPLFEEVSDQNQTALIEGPNLEEDSQRFSNELLIRAQSLEQKQQFQDSLIAYTQILETQPNLASAWLGKGRSTAWLSSPGYQRLDEAVTCFEKALTLGVSDRVEMRRTSFMLSSAVLAYTQEWIKVYTEIYQEEIPPQKTNLLSWATGSAQKHVKETLSEKLSVEFWQEKLPLLNGLWFAWWSLSSDLEVAQNIYGVIKTLKNSLIDPSYQDAFIRSLNPILFDIKAKFPTYKPPVKIKIEEIDEAEMGQEIAVYEQEAANEAAQQNDTALQNQPIKTETQLRKDSSPSARASASVQTASNQEPNRAELLNPSEENEIFLDHFSMESSTEAGQSDLDIAYGAEESQRFDQAYAAYDEILQVEPQHALAWLGKGRCAALLTTPDYSRLDEAVACFTKALEIGGIDESQCARAAILLSTETRNYTKDWLNFLAQPVKTTKMQFNPLAAKKSLRPSNEQISETFWENKLPIINSLWFAWWGLSKDIKVAEQIYQVLKLIKESPVHPDYQDAIINTLEPLLADIKNIYPKFKPPLKIHVNTDLETNEAEQPENRIAETQPINQGQENAGYEEVFQFMEPASSKQSAGRESPANANLQTINKGQKGVPVHPVNSISIAQAPSVPVEEKTIAIQVNSAKVVDPLQTAAAFEANQQYQEAFEVYSQVLTSNPQNSSAWLGKGRCSAWLSTPDEQKLDDAVACIKKAFEIGITNVDEVKTTSHSLGYAAMVYTKDLLVVLDKKYNIPAYDSKKGPVGSIFSALKSKNEAVTEALSEEFWGYNLPIFSSLFLCWRLSNDFEIANVIYDTISIIKYSGIAENYLDAFVETFNPIFSEIKTKFPKYKPPSKPRY